MLTTLLQSIGRTPLLRLSRLAAGLPGMLLLKLENQNPGGSIKDRAAFHILDRAMQRGELAPGGTVVEATSGNMGIGLAMTCAVRGLHCVLAMPESMSIERRQLLASLGAELILTPADKGMGGAVEVAENIAVERRAFRPRQFDNADAIEAHYTTTGPEILHDSNGAVDALVDYLDTEQPEEWTASRLCRETRSLIVRNAVEMDRYFPIQRSGRTYLLLVPFLREAQVMTVQDAYGTGWKDLLAEDPDTEESTAHYAAAMATCLLAMSTALTRLPLKLLPCGVVRGYLAESGMRESEPATLDDVRRAADWMRADAARWLDKMKRARDGEVPDYELLPRNCPRNKWCRL